MLANQLHVVTDVLVPVPLVVGVCVQTAEEIKAIIEESRKAVGVPMGAHIETDEYIDDAMENYDGEASLDYN